MTPESCGEELLALHQMMDRTYPGPSKARDDLSNTMNKVDLIDQEFCTQQTDTPIPSKQTRYTYK